MSIASIRPVIILFGILLVLYVGALVFGWFDSFPSFDIIMHLLGGAWAASLSLFLLRGFLPYDQYMHATEHIKVISLISAYGACVGVCWEFLEFILSPYFEGFRQNSVRDTLGDLFMDILGACIYTCVALFLFRKWKNQRT